MMPELVTLLVKSVHQGVADQKIDFDLSFTIQELKEKIHRVHPDQPLASDQRLIYFGQLLDNNLSLRTALRHPPENKIYTVHLAYPSPTRSTNLPTDCNVMAGSATNTDGLRRRNTGNDGPAVMGQMFNPSTFMSQMPPPQGLADPTQQMAALQQMYSQYMASYMQYMQTGNAAAFQTLQPPQIPTESPPVIQEPNAAPQPEVEPPNDVPNQPAPANEAGRVVVAEQDEEVVPRDWLDDIYWFIQMAVLLAVIHFHSSYTRLILVAVVIYVIHLYQSGFFTPVQRIRVDQPERPVAPPPAEEVPINDVDPTPEVAAPSQDQAAAPPQTPPRSILSLSYTFLTTFFTSLIPDNNPPIAI